MPTVTPDAGGGASGALLERDAELSMLVDCLEGVERSARGQVLLVRGEAGVGKTTLIRRFCEERGRSARILWGACDPLFTPSPLGPLLDVAQGSGGELRLVVERGAMPYEVVTALAQELSARAPTVFVLEDLHWADEATLDVLRLLARRVESVPALVVASFDIRTPPILVYERHGRAWQLAAFEWVFPSKPASPPLPGATYGSFGAACHYKDGTFVFRPTQQACPARSPQSGARFNLWHPDLVTLHVWAWYPNPAGLYSGTNPNVTPFNHT